jgi:hypothetical protein
LPATRRITVWTAPWSLNQEPQMGSLLCQTPRLRRLLKGDMAHTITILRDDANQYLEVFHSHDRLIYLVCTMFSFIT